MTTEDFYLPDDKTWLVLPLLGTVTTLCNVGGTRIMIRFGAGSMSDGFVMNDGATIVVDETVYVRAFDDTKKRPKIVVTR